MGASATPLSQTGRWVATPSLGFSGTHVVLLRVPGTDTAKVFMFGESGQNQQMWFWRFAPGDTNLITPTTVSSRSSLDTIPHPNGKRADLFCSGHATLPDGRMVLIGGSWFPAETCEDSYTLDPTWNVGNPTPWKRNAEMAVQRWYATATPLSDGTVLASAGTSNSVMWGFGGAAQGVSVAETTARVFRPLELSARFTWGDTTLAPADDCGGNCASPLTLPDDFTHGRFPPGREGHAFMGDPGGRAIIYGGRRKLGNGSYQLLDDVWLVTNSKALDDSTHGCYLLEQVGDGNVSENNGLPIARWCVAGTWAGVELGNKLAETTGSPICYIHGGKTASDSVLGDVWRGEMRQSGSHYRWYWKRELVGDATTARFGHTMMFDPGVPDVAGAPRAKLVIYGGLTSGGSLLDSTRLYLFGVGPDSYQKGTWRSMQPSGTAPVARVWQAMTPRYKGPNDTEREYYIFGGEDQQGTPVASEFWALTRRDQVPPYQGAQNDEEAFTWELYTTAGTAPTPRSRAAMAYSVDGDLVAVFGGDTTGTHVSGGLTNYLFRLQPAYNNNVWTWSTPPSRQFRAGPPPTAGIGMFALGEGRAHITRTMERFTPLGTYNLGACNPSAFGTWQTATDATSQSARPLADYPNIYQLPDGRLFNAGPAPGEDLAANRYKRFFSLASKQWSDTTGDNQDSDLFGSSVMYRPRKFLRAGAVETHGHSRTQTIDIAPGAMPSWVPYVDSVGGAPLSGHPALRVRTHANLTVLPTGDVLATGGVSDDRKILQSPETRRPQMWRVAEGRWTAPYDNDPERLADDPQIRNYHSTALLLPDARVLTAGGEKDNPNETAASVFEPPYLFRSNDSLAVRPHILLAPDSLLWGRSFTLTLTNPARAATIKSVALMRPGAVTHAFDQGQRYVPLDYVVAQNPPRLLVKGPANAYLAAPADHMIFVVDSLAEDAPRVPSIAHWTRVRATAARPDPADVTPPRGGSYLALRDTSTCPNLNANLTLGWTAPADDDTTAYSGWATAYNLRYKLNSSSETNFDAWTSVPTGTPGPLGTSESVVISGLSSALWYRFQIKAVGDNSDWSSISNALVAKPQYCDDGDGGDGFSARPAGAGTYSVQPTSSTPQGNSIFPGPLSGQSGRDALRLGHPPRLTSGGRVVFLREGGSRGLALDRARLVVVDHEAGTESAVTAGGGFVSGVRVPAASVTDHAGRDLLAEASALASEPVYADSGEVLNVTLPAAADSAQRLLIVEASAGGGPEPGIAVEALSATGEATALATLNPRRYWSTHVTTLAGASAVRLRFHGAYAVRFVGVLAQVNPAVATEDSLRSAECGGVDLTAEVRDLDGREAVIPAHDTLTMSFADVFAESQAIRDWYLAVDGLPLTAQVAAYRAGRTHDGPRQQPLAFALHQNVPNPFNRSTEFRFDLPIASDVELEVFDAQGRLIRRFDSRREAGRHRLEWDLRDSHGHFAAPGVYNYRLHAGSFVAQRKLVVLP